MILTTHALVGAAIGKNVQNPTLVIIFSLGVHYFLDGFRHGEYFDSKTATIKNTWWKVALDLTIGLGIIFCYLFYSGFALPVSFSILLGAFFSMFPDLLTVLFWKFGGNFLGKIKKFHEIAHRYTRFPRFSPERQWNLRNASNDIFFSATAILILFL